MKKHALAYAILFGTPLVRVGFIHRISYAKTWIAAARPPTTATPPTVLHMGHADPEFFRRNRITRIIDDCPFLDDDNHDFCSLGNFAI